MAELPKGVRLTSGCFRPKGGVVTGHCFKQMGYRRIGLEILGLKMPLIEMYDLFARQLELQLDDNRPSSTFTQHSYLLKVTLYVQFMLHVRIDPLDQMENLGQFFVDPRIDKPWGNTLREKLHDLVRLRYINWGAKERQHPSRPLTWPRLCTGLVQSPGKWVLRILVNLGYLVNLWMDVEAFRCFQLNQGLILDLEHLECVTLPLVQSRGHVFGGARPAGLGEAARPGILSNSAQFWCTCSWNHNSSKTHGTRQK